MKIAPKTYNEKIEWFKLAVLRERVSDQFADIMKFHCQTIIRRKTQKLVHFCSIRTGANVFSRSKIVIFSSLVVGKVILVSR